MAGTHQIFFCQALARYWHRPPHALLRGHFARTWFHVMPMEVSHPLAVVPDG
jgi:hypothetical protein